MNRAWIVALVVGAALSGFVFSGCYQIGSTRWYQSEYLEVQDSLLKKASFELDCPTEELVVIPLGTNFDGYDSVGVSGCDSKATYLWMTGSGGSKWVTNTGQE